MIIPKSNRIGRFSVSLDFVDACIEQGINIFDKTFVLGMQEDPFTDNISYLAYHPDFKEFEREEGDQYPEYVLLITKHEDESLTWLWEALQPVGKLTF